MKYFVVDFVPDSFPLSKSIQWKGNNLYELYEFVEAYRAVVTKARDGIGYDLKLRYMHENTKFYIDVSLGEYVVRDRRK